MPNRLINEKSPYLRQHANNPVDWYPWCEEAFEKAKRENKPIFLSIGYSTCHWCHVMEKESFEDPEIAKMMNETFVNIKVDREERPDIDQFYMNVCMLLTGRGGWPLTIIMTPDKKPFFAGTYFPKESRHGIIGMKDLIPKIKKLWEEKRDILEEQAEKIIGAINEEANQTISGQLDPSIIVMAYKHLEHSFDEKYGGFSNPPKFPSPHNLLFLLRYYKIFGQQKALEMVEKTLIEMRKGGIYDHVGFGFHRYSTDEKWLLPHFEKMLYDQAMLLVAYAEAYQATKNPLFRQTAEEIVEYLIRDMRSPEGAFYSAEDADSEGEEGKFYTWTYNEIKNILGEDFQIFKIISNIKEEGNYLEEATRQPSGRNIIYISKDWNVLQKETGLSVEDLKNIYHRSLKKLFEERKKRVRPLKDTKILTDWNGLIIWALSTAGVILNEKKFINTAKETADFILSKMYQNGTLYHRYKDGEVAFEGNLDDYAFLAFGLFNLYETTFEDKYFEYSYQLTQQMLEKFWDEKNGGFFFTSKDNKDVPVRQKEVYDGAYPSGNSIAYNLLVNLYKLVSQQSLYDYISNMESAFSSKIKLIPHGHTMFLIGYINLLYAYEIVVSGDKKRALDFRFFIEKEYIPHKVIGYKSETLEKYSEFISQLPKDNEFEVYICKNFSCQKPVSSEGEALNLLIQE